jgi:hypothetical protein
VFNIIKVLKKTKNHGFGGEIILRGNTLLTAQRKQLTPEGHQILAQRRRGVPEKDWDSVLKELAKSSPGLWLPDNTLRVVKNHCVTTAYVTFLALMHQTDATTIGDFKYHDSGIGTGDEAVGDVGLGTPWGGARDVGTQVASTNTYTSVATTTYNATKAITEHGLFNASSSVTLMDRTKFAAINVVDTNQIQWTFVITFTAGG